MNYYDLCDDIYRPLFIDVRQYIMKGLAPDLTAFVAERGGPNVQNQFFALLNSYVVAAIKSDPQLTAMNDAEMSFTEKHNEH